MASALAFAAIRQAQAISAAAHAGVAVHERATQRAAALRRAGRSDLADEAMADAGPRPALHPPTAVAGSVLSLLSPPLHARPSAPPSHPSQPT